MRLKRPCVMVSREHDFEASIVEPEAESTATGEEIDRETSAAGSAVLNRGLPMPRGSVRMWRQASRRHTLQRDLYRPSRGGRPSVACRSCSSKSAGLSSQSRSSLHARVTPWRNGTVGGELRDGTWLRRIVHTR